jgi:hypothetical protein
MTHFGKRALIGALIAAVGAYAWALLDFSFYAVREGWVSSIPLVAAYAVLVSSWFVLPIGAALGLVMPWMVRDCSPGGALCRGMFLGVAVGVLAAILTIVAEYWPGFSGRTTIVDPAAWERFVRGRFLGYLATMTPICAVWVGIWAYRWSKKAQVKP